MGRAPGCRCGCIYPRIWCAMLSVGAIQTIKLSMSLSKSQSLFIISTTFLVDETIFRIFCKISRNSYNQYRHISFSRHISQRVSVTKSNHSADILRTSNHWNIVDFRLILNTGTHSLAEESPVNMNISQRILHTVDAELSFTGKK